jgi:curved DNA-binding protein CbpA
MSEIDRILNATDHYEVLGVERDAEAASLRKAYLRRSVQVHPDKNSDPRATTAFQKVALAWQVLSDDDARAEYDVRGEDCAGEQRGETYYAPPPQPSFRDALFMFSTVTSMMGGGKLNVAGDIAQTLFWAEKIVQTDRDHGSSEMQKKANVAMAVGSSLRVASAAASMLGLRKSAAKLEQTANMAQMAGMGAIVVDAAKDTPGVKQALEHGGKALQQGSKHLQSLRNSISPEQIEKIRGSVSAVRGMMQKESASSHR